MEKKVRLANEQDLDFIYTSLLEDLAEQHLEGRFQYPKEVFKEIIFGKHPIASFLILVIDDQPVGFANYNIDYRNYTVNPGPNLYLNDLYIKKGYRKLGGTKLLGEGLREIAKQNNCARIEGVVQKDNDLAMKVYKSIPGVQIKDSLHYLRLNIE
jgi:hypothetical protein